MDRSASHGVLDRGVDRLSPDAGVPPSPPPASEAGQRIGRRRSSASAGAGGVTSMPDERSGPCTRRRSPQPRQLSRWRPARGRKIAEVVAHQRDPAMRFAMSGAGASASAMLVSGPDGTSHMSSTLRHASMMKLTASGAVERVVGAQGRGPSRRFSVHGIEVRSAVARVRSAVVDPREAGLHVDADQVAQRPAHRGRGRAEACVAGDRGDADEFGATRRSDDDRDRAVVPGRTRARHARASIHPSMAPGARTGQVNRATAGIDPLQSARWRCARCRKSDAEAAVAAQVDPDRTDRSGRRTLQRSMSSRPREAPSSAAVVEAGTRRALARLCRHGRQHRRCRP